MDPKVEQNGEKNRESEPENGAAGPNEAEAKEEFTFRIPLELLVPSDISLYDLQVAVKDKLAEVQLEPLSDPMSMLLGLNGQVCGDPLACPLRMLVPGSVVSMVDGLPEAHEVSRLGICLNACQLKQVQWSGFEAQKPLPEDVLRERRAKLYKTVLCTNYTGPAGYCSFGKKCHFAHGKAELRVLGNAKPVEKPQTEWTWPDKSENWDSTWKGYNKNWDKDWKWTNWSDWSDWSWKSDWSGRWSDWADSREDHERPPDQEGAEEHGEGPDHRNRSAHRAPSEDQERAEHRERSERREGPTEASHEGPEENMEAPEHERERDSLERENRQRKRPERSLDRSRERRERTRRERERRDRRDRGERRRSRERRDRELVLRGRRSRSRRH